MVLFAFLFALTHAETFSIFRVEPQHNQAVIATIEAQKFSPGNEFVVETPQGDCFLVVKKIVTDYIYVDTEQCQREYLSKGKTVAPRQKVVIEKQIVETQIVDTAIPQDSVTTDSSLDSDVYNRFIKDRLSLTASYLTGNSLDGRANLTNNTVIEDMRGSNTMSLGADYTYWHLPYNLTLSGGLQYSLPRSFGRYQLISNGHAQNVDFSGTPKFQAFSFFTNMRYHWTDQTWAYVGLNRLFVDSSGFVGEMSGDFGFHIGARHYIANKFFADGSFNFYNLNYKVSGRTYDYSLSELELKAGYTF